MTRATLFPLGILHSRFCILHSRFCISVLDPPSNFGLCPIFDLGCIQTSRFVFLPLQRARMEQRARTSRMPFTKQPNAEPIPGYRLIAPLGSGGFGEVWKCEAPGGLFKAIKFVYGNLDASDEEGARAEQELKALSRVKTVHHPYILSLERYDIIDGQLLIVMELADRTLWDRFRECRAQNLVGIPREELLRYMEEIAEGLDLMNIQYQLQHLDI